MKFLKLTLKNFKPYYEKVEVPLFDRERSGKLITLNVGPCEHGKTSISEAITWCLYGELRGKKREELCVNDFAKQVAKEKNSKVGMSVRLKVEKQGKTYEIVRSKSYKVEERKGEERKKLVVTDVTQKNGLHVLNEKKEELGDPNAFIKENFVPYDLMKYFNFNAEELLSEFIENPAETIKDSINRLLGIDTLDETIRTLNGTIKLYNKDIKDLQSEISQEPSQKLERIEESLKSKKKAIEEYEEDIKEANNKMKQLEARMRNVEKTRKYRNLINEREDIEKSLKELNDTFLGKGDRKNVISQVYLIFLQRHISQLESKLQKRKPTSNEFKEALKTLTSALEDEYRGIKLSSKENCKLIKKSANIPDSVLEEINSLDLEKTEAGIQRRTISNIVYKFDERLEKARTKFWKLSNSLGEKLEEFRKVKNKIKNYGKSLESKKAVSLINDYEKWEKSLKRNKEEIEDLREEKSKLENKKKEIKEKIKIKKTKEKEWNLLSKEKENVQEIIEALKEIKERYLNDLLNGITEKSSKILRNLVEDQKRFHSLEILPDYSYYVVKEDGSRLSPQETSKSVRQSTVMAFFLGIAEYLGREVPYVIDNPFMRLDAPHAIRLINLLRNEEKQIILHLLPTRESTKKEWSAFKGSINTQNWIGRDIQGERSYIEPKDPNTFIAWEG